MGKIASIIVALLIALSAPAPAQQSHFPSDSAIRALLQQRVEQKRTSGIVVAVLDADGRSRVIAYGDAGAGQPPLDGNSIFELGSITKVFTSTVLADMVLKRTVKLDDPVQTYLPAGVKVPQRNGKVITLGNLSAQNSGLPRLPGNLQPIDFKNPYAQYTAQKLYEFLNSYQLPRDPGEKWEYSNLGVGLLGHTLSLHARQSYEQLVRQRVLEPLHMDHTAAALTPWMRQHLALPHDALGNVTSGWDFDVLAGAGALRSNANDMLKFLDANIHTERKPLGPAFALAHQDRAAAMGPMRIGLNWLLAPLKGDTLISHDGGTGGYRTFIGFTKQGHYGVVVLSNGGGEGIVDIGLHLLDPTVPLKPATTAQQPR